MLYQNALVHINRYLAKDNISVLYKNCISIHGKSLLKGILVKPYIHMELSSITFTQELAQELQDRHLLQNLNEVSLLTIPIPF